MPMMTTQQNAILLFHLKIINSQTERWNGDKYLIKLRSLSFSSHNSRTELTELLRWRRLEAAQCIKYYA